MKEILKIRALQIRRIFASVGFFRVLFILFGLAFLVFVFFVKMQDESLHSLIVSAYFIGVGTIQLKRKDHAFLTISFEEEYQICFVEYLILSLPLLLALIINYLWLYLFIYFVGLFLLPLITFKRPRANINTFFQQWIPDSNYEWKGGLRRSLFIFIPVWILALVVSFFVGSVPVAILILGILVMNFYEKSEPLNFILLPELDASYFLRRKMSRHSLLFLLINLPLLFVFLFFHPELYYIPLFELLLFAILIPYFILVKYAFYRIDDKDIGAGQIFSSIGILSIFIPFLLPLVLGLMIHFMLKANQNLKFYLDDYN